MERMGRRVKLVESELMVVKEIREKGAQMVIQEVLGI